ncbi:MAG TPA: type II toxin-antitoxin system HicA family toxin [Spirochaetota bacterium]|nr:type II toxin-antitoxin system HicA family toxin [Spirochaetota bacterium]
MPLSGKEMLKKYLKEGWVKLRQKGSHVAVFKEGEGTVEIPMHKELKKGTESFLLKRLKGEK